MLGLAFTVFAYLPRLALILYWRFTVEFACSVKRTAIALRIRMHGSRKPLAGTGDSEPSKGALNAGPWFRRTRFVNISPDPRPY